MKEKQIEEEVCDGAGPKEENLSLSQPAPMIVREEHKSAVPAKGN